MASSRKLFSLFGSLVISGLAESKKELTAFEKDVRKLNRDLNSLGRDMTKVGKSFTKNITLPLLGAAAASIKFGADFDEAMTNSLAIMTDFGNVSREELEGVARDVAKTTKFSATQAAEAYYFLASAGLTAAESMKALPEVAKFAQAGNFDLAQATDLLTDAQSALGLSSENIEERMQNMARISDVLVKANTIANASVQQFSESLTNKAGAALRLLNKDVEEGAAVLAVYADQGVKGADAGTQLNIVLRDLQKASIANKQGFKDAGIAVFDAEGNMRNMADIVADLEGRLGGMSDEQKQSELTTLGFTSKSIAATKALLGTSEAIREYETTLRGAAGTTDEVAKKQMATFWKQLGIMKDKAIDLGLTLYQYLEPILTGVVIPAIDKLITAIEGLLNWFGEHKVIATFIASFAALMAVAGPVLLAFVQFLPLIKSLLVMYKAWTAAQIGLNASMSANPIALWTVGIAALIAAGVALWKNWDVVSEKFTEVWGGISAYFKIIAGSIGLGFNNLILGVLKGINKVGKHVPLLNKGLEKSIKALEKNSEELERWTDSAAAANEERKATSALLKQEKVLIEKATEATKEKAAEDKDAADQKKTLTLEELNAAKKIAEEKAKFESDWTKKIFEESATRVQILEAEKGEALKSATALGVDKERIAAYYDAKIAKNKADASLEAVKAENAAQNVLEQSRIDLMDGGLARLQAETALRVEQLEQQKDEAVRIAEETGGDVEAIRQTYANKRLAIEQDAANKELKIAEKTANEKKNKLRRVLGYVGDVVGKINNVWQASLDKRTKEIDSEREQRIASAEATIESEEGRAEAIEAINEEADEKKRELQKENAVREKAAALFGIAINTALAVVSALTIPPPAGIILAGIVGVLGAVQLGIAAAQPIPFADGGLVRSSPGKGVIARVGESTQDELVLPMKTGVAELTDSMMARLGGKAGAFANGAVSNSRKIVKEVHNHFHIGTLIADDFGVKTLAKRIRPYTIAENQRTGA